MNFLWMHLLNLLELFLLGDNKNAHADEEQRQRGERYIQFLYLLLYV